MLILKSMSSIALPGSFSGLIGKTVTIVGESFRQECANFLRPVNRQVLEEERKTKSLGKNMLYVKKWESTKGRVEERRLKFRE
jgi:hypothetical protein